MKRLTYLFVVGIVALLTGHIGPSMLVAQDALAASETVVQRLYDEVFAAGDLAVLDEIADPAFVDHRSPDANGVETLRARAADLHNGWRVLEVDVEHMVVTDDLVVAKVTYQILKSAIGRYEVWSEINILHLENGKLMDLWSIFPIDETWSPT